MLHIVSDLDLSYLEKAEDQLLLDIEAKYIIVTGNISTENKRAMLFGDQLALKYPNSHVIFNYGLLEYKGKLYTAVEDGFNARLKIFKNKPDNLHYPKGEVIGDYDFFCAMGWPIFASQTDYNQSILTDRTVMGWNEQLYIGDKCVTEKFHRIFTMDFVQEKANLENQNILEWLNVDNQKKKILVSAFGKDSSNILKNKNYSVFNGLDLENILWISGSDDKIVLPNHITCPGRDRSNFFDLP